MGDWSYFYLFFFSEDLKKKEKKKAYWVLVEGPGLINMILYG